MLYKWFNTDRDNYIHLQQRMEQNDLIEIQYYQNAGLP